MSSDLDKDKLWEAIKKSTTKKKESKKFEGRLAQTKVELTIKGPEAKPPKDDRFSFDSGAFEPGCLEFKGTKKLSKKLVIDAKVDLHGLTQDQALKRLIKFIQTCFANRVQNILVITGKGLQIQQQAGESAKGVLRRNLPGWLESPELRSYIHHYTNTHPFEGGTGAFYVRLRRNKEIS